MKSSSASVKVPFKVPERLSDEGILKLTEKLRATNCPECRDALIQGHMRLAIYLAGRYIKSNKHRTDDLICSALHGLTQAVTWAPERLVDNNITPYIASTVTRFIRDYLQKDAIISIERRALKKMEESGLPVILPYFNALEYNDSDEENFIEGGFIDNTPSIEDDITPLEHNDMLSFLHQGDDRTAYIIQALLEGYKMREIGEEIGISKQAVHVIVQSLRDRVGLWYKYHA